LEPYLESWAKESMPDNAELVQVPAALNPSWKVHARAFYVAKSLGVLDSVHGPLMTAIHVDGKRLDDKQSLTEFFAGQGVDEADFEKTYDSFAVETGMRRAAFLAERAGIGSVPSIIVGGKYETSVSMAGGHEELLQVINYLVEREAQEAS
jgi:thiol:disulfide interchange protein DsbA